ncbi:unnamed protein product, partial [Laminaria digitata]
FRCAAKGPSSNLPFIYGQTGSYYAFIISVFINIHVYTVSSWLRVCVDPLAHRIHTINTSYVLAPPLTRRGKMTPQEGTEKKPRLPGPRSSLYPVSGPRPKSQ